MVAARRGSRDQRSKLSGSNPGGGVYRHAPHAPGGRPAPRRSEHRHSGRYDRRSDSSGREAGGRGDRDGDGAGRPDVALLPDGRFGATVIVSYSSVPMPKRFFFYFTQIGGRLLIDGILGEIWFSVP